MGSRWAFSYVVESGPKEAHATRLVDELALRMFEGIVLFCLCLH